MDNKTLISTEYSDCNCGKTASFYYKRKKKGNNFNIYKGRMYSCCKDIQTAVVKVTANGKGSKEDLPDYIIASQAAHDLANKFSKLCSIFVHFPEIHIAEMDTVAIFDTFIPGDCRKLSGDEFVLFEPYVKDLQNFVTREGIVTKVCPAVIQELCHFSFHQSNGDNILRGLKGSWEKNGKSFRLASPATKYFPEKCSADEIPCAITNFFSVHTCTSRCNKWLVPSQVHSSRSEHQFDNSFSDPPPPYESIDFATR
ncbi:uncharacterized protein LOC133171971 [Saccostrea echinata]|uniref:uncharacterized protein LOC133171971 n=1 Tax=Saccostrea echinata TaxID=191078 RepID=UPI002A804C2C|nr:uncharacterized protein LOC133171971 [Saccostrea echinata]